MILIIGGAYQGKLSYAMEHYKPAAVFNCDGSGTEIDFSADAINYLHKLILVQLREGIDPMDYIKRHVAEMRTKIIICDDISCGVVPVDAEMRTWREAVGCCLNYLSSEADEVIRLFCGIGSRIK